MARRMSAVLTLALAAGAVAAAGVGAPGSGLTRVAVETDNAPPEGSYRFLSTNIWTGQSATLIQTSLSDDSTAPADLTQTINWDDGTFQTVPGTTTTVTHAYPVEGTYAPKVTISDGTYEVLGGKETPGYVAVFPGVGPFHLTAKSVYVGNAIALRHNESSDTDSIRVTWGDGTASSVPASLSEARVNHYYKTAGTFTVKAALVNENGTATPNIAGTVVATLDQAKPVATLTKPASPTKAASWATLKGKSSDVGLGVDTVSLTAVQKRGSYWYYYNGSAWKKATSYASALSKAKVLTAKPSTSGAWSTKLKATALGKLLIHYKARDKAANVSAQKSLEQVVTKK